VLLLLADAVVLALVILTILLFTAGSTNLQNAMKCEWDANLV
jgi:hypothetical protein